MAFLTPHIEIPEFTELKIVNQSAHISNEQYILLAEAAQYQLRHHICPHWRLKDITLFDFDAGIPVSYYSFRLSRQPVIYLTDEAPPDANTLHRHELDAQGNCISKVYVDKILSPSVGGSIFFNPSLPTKDTVSRAFSHEVCEVAVNPYNMDWYTANTVDEYSNYNNPNPTTNITFYKKDICDPVYKDTYLLFAGQQGILMSNFVLPDFFNTQAPEYENFDFLGLKNPGRPVKSKFVPAPGGYIKTMSGTFVANFVENPLFHNTQLATGTVYASDWQKTFK